MLEVDRVHLEFIGNASRYIHTFRNKLFFFRNNVFVNVGNNTDKDISPGSYCPTSFLKGNFPDSMFLAQGYFI